MNKCIGCNKELKGHDNPIRCKSCSKKGNLHPLYGRVGENSVRWKGGKPKCEDCKIQLTHYDRLRCRSCAAKIRAIILVESGKLLGSNSGRWIDGRSYEKYPREFNEKLKEIIKKRDNYQCQNCNMIDEEHIIVYGRHIEVHHIDYNKKNCKENNLITLCKACNLRANMNRSVWKKIYVSKNKNRKENDETRRIKFIA